MPLQLQNKILSKGEIAAVLKYLRAPQRIRRIGTRGNLVIFRLACCCALRRCEIAGLELRDFFVKSDRPFIRIRKEATKTSRKPGAAEATGRSRKVSLAIDDDTRKDLVAWLEIRKRQTGGDLNAPFVCAQRAGRRGERLSVGKVGERWRSAIKVLGEERVREVGIHDGRHTCISHLAWAGAPLAFVRDFAGHSDISITSIYLHSCNEDELPKNVFATA